MKGAVQAAEPVTAAANREFTSAAQPAFVSIKPHLSPDKFSWTVPLIMISTSQQGGLPHHAFVPCEVCQLWGQGSQRRMTREAERLEGCQL